MRTVLLVVSLVTATVATTSGAETPDTFLSLSETCSIHSLENDRGDDRDVRRLLIFTLDTSVVGRDLPPEVWITSGRHRSDLRDLRFPALPDLMRPLLLATASPYLEGVLSGTLRDRISQMDQRGTLPDDWQQRFDRAQAKKRNGKRLRTVGIPMSLVGVIWASLAPSQESRCPVPETLAEQWEEWSNPACAQMEAAERMLPGLGVGIGGGTLWTIGVKKVRAANRELVALEAEKAAAEQTPLGVGSYAIPKGYDSGLHVVMGRESRVFYSFRW